MMNNLRKWIAAGIMVAVLTMSFYAQESSSLPAEGQSETPSSVATSSVTSSSASATDEMRIAAASAAVPQDGWYSDGDRTYFYQNGLKATGFQRIEGKNYYFNEEGVLQKTGWTQIDGKWYYLYISNGQTCDPGWQTVANKPYYITEEGYALTGLQRIDGKNYYFDETGELQKTGWTQIDGKWYYLYISNGQTCDPGWQTVANKPYYITEEGYALTGFQRIDGKNYYFDETGELQKTGWTVIDGKRYYLYISNGQTCDPGWQIIGNETYYITDEGYALTGEQEIDGQTYYFDPETGRYRVDGWYTEEGTTCYYKNGVKATGFLRIDGKNYYFNEAGELQKTGWTVIGGKRYYLYISNGQTCDPGWQIIGNETYYITDEGYALTGEQEIDGQTYYFDPETGRYRVDGWYTENDATCYYRNGVKTTGLQRIDGKNYFFNEAGELQKTGWTEIGGKRYYFYLSNGQTCDPGWQTIGNQPYYVTQEGYVLTGFQEIGGKRYYFDEMGVLQKTGWTEIDGKWYYLYLSTGQMCDPGWQVVGDQTYYFTADNYIVTGFQQLEGKKYYFNENGVLQKTGWTVIDGKRYYLYLSTGQMCDPGWQTVGDALYYFTDGGYVLTGDQVINGELWHLDPETGRTYPNGWNTIDNKIYYYEYGLYKSGGWYTIDNRSCYFTAEGWYVAPPVINSVLYTVSGNQATVTISATASSASSLNVSAYSWDGGKTWTNEASKVFSVGTTIAAGTIQVRDAVGNITTYGSELKLTGNGPYMGIDVSAYQGIVDWAAVKASGVDFAIIRALTWSNPVGYYVIDPYFEYNVRSAKANGIDVGVYLFSYAFNIEEIKEEIDFFHNSAEMKRLRADGIKFDYPVYIDFEWNTILQHTTYSQRTEMLRTGMIILEKYGYFPGFYSSMSWALNQYDAKSLYNEGYHFWCARYPANPDISAGTGSWLGFEAQMWQYASDGRVNGVNGNVDMNICYVDYSSIIAGSESGGGSAELTLSVYDVNSGKQVTGSVEDILAQVVMNEVGAWGNTEVCKAQAVAAYSWILYQQQHGNVIPSVGLATPTQTVKNAVKQVAGQALYYNGSVANAAYGSASAAYTNTASNMWSLNLPYLNTPVSSPETAYRGKSTTVKYSTMLDNMTKLVGASLANSTPHDQWITNPVFDANGYLISIKVCGKTVSGGTFYENCWGLLSPKFQMTYNALSDSWTFVTDGNGHCVGMSQYGAYEFAKSGWTYQQILAHYYPGTTLR